MSREELTVIQCCHSSEVLNLNIKIMALTSLPPIYIYIYIYIHTHTHTHTHTHRTFQMLSAHADGCHSRPWLVRWPASGPSYRRCFQTLTLLFQFIFRVDGHVHRYTFCEAEMLAFTDCDYCYTLVL